MSENYWVQCSDCNWEGLEEEYDLIDTCPNCDSDNIEYADLEHCGVCQEGLKNERD